MRKGEGWKPPSVPQLVPRIIQRINWIVGGTWKLNAANREDRVGGATRCNSETGNTYRRANTRTRIRSHMHDKCIYIYMRMYKYVYTNHPVQTPRVISANSTLQPRRWSYMNTRGFSRISTGYAGNTPSYVSLHEFLIRRDPSKQSRSGPSRFWLQAWWRRCGRENTLKISMEITTNQWIILVINQFYLLTPLKFSDVK